MKHRFNLGLLAALLLAGLFVMVGSSTTATALPDPQDSICSVPPAASGGNPNIWHCLDDDGLYDGPFSIRCMADTPASQFPMHEGEGTGFFWHDGYQMNCNGWGSPPNPDGVDQVYVGDGWDLACQRANGTWYHKWKATGWHTVVDNGVVYNCVKEANETPGV